jgi:hypothetical protein
MEISFRRVISIEISSRELPARSAAATNAKRNVYTAPLPGDERMPCTSSPEKSLTNIKSSKSAM